MVKSEHAILTNVNEDDERIIEELVKGEPMCEALAVGHIIHRVFEFNMINDQNILIRLDIGKINGRKIANIEVVHVSDEKLMDYRYNVLRRRHVKI